MAPAYFLSEDALIPVRATSRLISMCMTHLSVSLNAMGACFRLQRTMMRLPRSMTGPAPCCLRRLLRHRRRYRPLRLDHRPRHPDHHPHRRRRLPHLLRHLHRPSHLHRHHLTGHPHHHLRRRLLYRPSLPLAHRFRPPYQLQQLLSSSHSQPRATLPTTPPMSRIR